MIDRFGEKLKQLREEAKLTQGILADRLGYKNQGYISELESSTKKPTAELILRIALLFKVTTDELMRDDRDLEKKGS